MDGWIGGLGCCGVGAPSLLSFHLLLRGMFVHVWFGSHVFSATVGLLLPLRSTLVLIRSF
jgi:hypothetical protein